MLGVPSEKPPAPPSSPPLFVLRHRCPGKVSVVVGWVLLGVPSEKPPATPTSPSSLCGASSVSRLSVRGRRVGAAGGSVGKPPAAPTSPSSLSALRPLLREVIIAVRSVGLPPSLVGLPPHTPPVASGNVGRATALPRGATAPHSANRQRKCREGYRPPSWGYRPTLRLNALSGAPVLAYTTACPPSGDGRGNKSLRDTLPDPAVLIPKAGTAWCAAPYSTTSRVPVSGKPR